MVQADIDSVRIVLGNINDLYTDTLQPGQVARSGRVGPGSRLGRGINCIDIEVLVSGIVFHEQDGLAVTGPEIACDGALGFRSQQTGRAEWLIHAFDVDI